MNWTFRQDRYYVIAQLGNLKKDSIHLYLMSIITHYLSNINMLLYMYVNFSPNLLYPSTKEENFMLKKFMLIIVLAAISATALSAIIEAPHPQGNIIVKESDGSQTLYYDNSEILSNTYVTINRILPTPENVDELYLIQSDAGGSGTVPSYVFFTVKGESGKMSEEFGSGEMKSLINDGKTVTIKFAPLADRFGGGIVSPAQTVIYKNGVVKIK